MHTQKPDEIRNQLQIIRFFDLRHSFFQSLFVSYSICITEKLPERPSVL